MFGTDSEALLHFVQTALPKVGGISLEYGELYFGVGTLELLEPGLRD